MKKTVSSALEPIRDYTRLTAREIALICQLADADKKQTEIAHIVGCSQPTVSKVLSEFQDTRTLARNKTNNAALRIAEAAIEGTIKAAKDAKPESALELLDRLDVAPKRVTQTGQSQVNIVIGMPGQPAGPRPTVEVLNLSPSTFAPNAPEQGAGSD